MFENPNLIITLLFFVVMYIFFFLPQIRKNKKQKQFIAELKKGDKIVTSGGIHGKIAELKDLTCIIDTGGGAKLKINRGAINMEASALLADSPSED
ncbi:MAG: preprotein translocase subunit YajC [Bacteroidetes bacterium]|jgi:preprotein translocase subunit YajC|nr:preprotein translocase subunit YajC [Bacteroidota bacterium]